MLMAPEGDGLCTRGDFLLHAFVFSCSVLGNGREPGVALRTFPVAQGEPCLKACCSLGAQGCWVKHGNDCGSSQVWLFRQEPFCLRQCGEGD